MERSQSVSDTNAWYSRSVQEAKRRRRKRRISIATTAPTTHEAVDYELEEVRDMDMEEYKRRVHLRCEHRRRDAIAAGTTRLQDAIMQVLGIDTDRMTKIGIVQEAVRLVIGLKDRRMRLARERDKLLAMMRALETGDKGAVKQIEHEWQVKQLGGELAASTGGNQMISGDDTIPALEEMIREGVGRGIIWQQQEWMDVMNGAGLNNLTLQDDALADTLTTRSTSVSIEPSLASGEESVRGRSGRSNGANTNAAKGKRSRRRIRISPRRIGR